MTQTVLVTGASGFVAAHILDSFLDAGYNVKATVRSQRSADGVIKKHSNYAGQLSFAIVEDIAAEGAIDKALDGVDGVIHTASPFILGATDYEKELYTTAVNGTLNVLKSVKAHGPNVKRIVITSSFASAIDTTKGNRSGYTYTEADWNLMPKDKVDNPVDAYLISKSLAEKAAWDFIEKEKPNFTLTTLLPPMVYGPLRHDVSSLKSLNTSSADLYRLFNGDTMEIPPTSFAAYIDARDRKYTPRRFALICS
jgi:nucleoside-diphosphate-sugar epimerase